MKNYNKKIKIKLTTIILSTSALLASGYIAYLKYNEYQQHQAEQAQIIFVKKLSTLLNSGEYNKTYHFIMQHQKEHNEKYYHALRYTIKNYIEKLIENKKYSKIIDLYSTGENKIFDIDSDLFNKIIDSNNKNLINFSLKYILQLNKKENKKHLLSSYKTLELDEIYYLALSLGNIDITNQINTEIIKKHGHHHINKNKILESLKNQGNIESLKYSQSKKLINIDNNAKSSLIEGYIKSYPQSKNSLIYILKDIKKTNWDNFNEEYLLKIIYHSLIDKRRENLTESKEIFHILKEYGFIEKLKSHKEKINTLVDFNYDIFLFFAQMGEHQLFEDYLKIVNPSLINLDGYNDTDGNDISSYPAYIFSINNDMKGLHILERHGYSFKGKNRVNEVYIPIAASFGSVDIARYYIEHLPNFKFNNLNNYISNENYDKNNTKHKDYILFLIKNTNFKKPGHISALELAYYYHDKDLLLSAFHKGLEVKYQDLSNLDNYKIPPEIKNLIVNKKKEQDIKKPQEKKSTRKK